MKWVTFARRINDDAWEHTWKPTMLVSFSLLIIVQPLHACLCRPFCGDSSALADPHGALHTYV